MVYYTLELLFPQQALPDSKADFTNHWNNLPSLQSTSASRDLINVSHEKLQKDNALLDPEARNVKRSLLFCC